MNQQILSSAFQKNLTISTYDTAARCRGYSATGGRVSKGGFLPIIVYFIASQEISATFKQHICDMPFNAVAVALKSRIAISRLRRAPG